MWVSVSEVSFNLITKASMAIAGINDPIEGVIVVGIVLSLVISCGMNNE